MKKTFNDCAACDAVGVCNAHHSKGSWDHTKGVDPCEFELSTEKDTDWDEIFGIS